MEQRLDNILDNIVEDVLKEYPEKSEFEAGFMALRMNLTILVQQLAEVGMLGQGLSHDALYGVCSGLVDTCQWMASKEMAADTMRDIEEI